MKQYTRILILVLLVSIFSVNTVHASTPTEVFTFQNDLSVGLSGTDVANLQVLLLAKGYDIPSLRSGQVQKGYFGSQTKTAVIKFQMAMKLPPTGFVGPLTRARLNQTETTTDFSIKVISPNGNDLWEAGSVHRISWNIVSMIPSMELGHENHVDLYLETATGTLISLDKNIVASTRYDWIVGTDVNNNTLPLGQYKVVACFAGSMTYCDKSDAIFTIIAGTSNQASITTVSPNGGERWAIGSAQTIKWDFTKGSNNQQNYAVDITISNHTVPVACPAGYTCLPVPRIYESIAKNIPAQQETYIWTVGNLVSGHTFPLAGFSDYDMSICFAGTNNCAVSDAPFTVNVVTQPNQ